MKSIRILGALWAIVGFTFVIADAIYRVLPHVTDAFRVGLTPLEWLVMIIWCAFMVVSEGYRGFQKKLAPRFASRLYTLTHEGQLLDCILAPLYCVGYYDAPRTVIITSWSLTIGIIMLVVIVRTFLQPWRGVIDSGVVLGLAYGLLWIYVCAYRTFKTV